MLTANRLQEQYLSRRTIVFVNGQAYFRCRKRIWSEDTCADLNPKQHDSEAWFTNIVALAQESLENDDDPERFYIYLQECVSRFQMRTLTHDDDAINAMAGILTRVSLLSEFKVLQGALEPFFPSFLTFWGLKGARPESFISKLELGWMGWNGQLGRRDWHFRLWFPGNQQ